MTKTHILWKGALTFGLVHIPIRIYSASLSRQFKFKLLHKKDLSEIRYARICVADGKEIPWEQIVKEYEYEEGKYVVMTDDDFKKASPTKTKTIEILDFTEESQVDTIFYDTPYYIEPEKGAENAYALSIPPKSRFLNHERYKEEAKKSTKVHNILSLLKESLAKREKSKKRKSA
jgi:Ku protein